MHSALDMTRYWRQLDAEVAQTPMPTEYQNMMVEVRGRPCSLAWFPWSCALEFLAAEGTRDACWIRSQTRGWGTMREKSRVGFGCSSFLFIYTHTAGAATSPSLPPSLVSLQILCNDCSARSTVQFHLLGMKCQSCESYNTAQDGRCRLSLEEQ